MDNDESTIDFLDTVEIELTNDFNSNAIEINANKDMQQEAKLVARRKIEDLLEGKRLQKEIEDLNDLDDF